MIRPFMGKAPRIHPEAFIHEAAVVIGDVVIGAESSAWPNATLRGDDGPIVIGDQTSIQDACVVHMVEDRSDVHIGSRVTVGHGAILHGCDIGDDCLIGMGAIILDNAVVGSNVIVSAGTLVPPGKQVPSGTVIKGSPFEIARECTEADLEFIEFSWTKYIERLRQYKADV